MKNDVTSAIPIAYLEERMLMQQQVEIKVTHSFAPGMYAREIFVPNGTILLGHKHKEPCLNILAQGKMVLKKSLEEEGTVITAPFTFSTGAGSQKIAVCLKDAIFINVFTTEETNIEKLEEALIEKSEVFLKHERSKQIKKEGD